MGVVLVLAAAMLVLGAVALVAAPEVSACVQVYPFSALCGDPVAGASKIACWETGGTVCLP